MLSSLRRIAGSERLKPRQCLELVSEELCPGHLLVLDSAWSSAEDAKGFEHGDQLFELLWLLATRFRDSKLVGAPDRIAGQVFGGSSYAPRSPKPQRKIPRPDVNAPSPTTARRLKCGSTSKLVPRIQATARCAFTFTGTVTWPRW